MGKYSSYNHAYFSARVSWKNYFEKKINFFFRFSEAKKCSNGGRALMQLDFTQFLTKFEKISGLRPVPHREYVENYVKAYYLPEIELENWIREHKVRFLFFFK